MFVSPWPSWVALRYYPSRMGLFLKIVVGAPIMGVAGDVVVIEASGVTFLAPMVCMLFPRGQCISLCYDVV